MNKKIPKNQRCSNCLYYSAAEPDNNRNSACTRYPPQGDRLPADDYGENNTFDSCPSPNAWCGEWAPANPETVDEAARTLARFVILGDLTAARALVDKLKETR